MTNDDLRELMSAAIDGDLREEDRARLDAALEADASLRAEYAELERTVAHLQALDEVEPPADLLARVRGELDDSRSGRGIIHWLSLPHARLIAAAAMLLIVVRFGFEMDRVDPLSDTDLGSRAEQKAGRPGVPAPVEAVARLNSEASAKNETSSSSTTMTDAGPKAEDTPPPLARVLRVPRKKGKLDQLEVERSVVDEGSERESGTRTGAARAAIPQESAGLGGIDEREPSREARRGETRDRLMDVAGAGEGVSGRVRVGDDMAEDFGGRESSGSPEQNAAMHSAPGGKSVASDKVLISPAPSAPVVSDPNVAVRERRRVTALRSDEALELRKALAAAADQEANVTPNVVVLEVAGPDADTLARAALEFRVPGADNSGDRAIAAGYASVEYAVSRTIVIGEFEPSKLSLLVRALAQHGECHLSRIDGKPVTDPRALQRLKDRVTVLVLISRRQSAVIRNP